VRSLLTKWAGRREADERGLAPKDARALRAQGLEVVDWIDVPLAELQVQHRSEWRYGEVFPGADRTLARSPWMDLVRDYAEHGAEDLRGRYRATSYYALLRHFSSIGWYLDWSTGQRVEFSSSDEDIWQRMALFFATYDSLRRHGYLGPGYENRPLIVLREPYEVQRFAREVPWTGYEVWSGHHRGASLLQLGHESARAALVRYSGGDGE
jgi:hypothetical protein